MARTITLGLILVMFAFAPRPASAAPILGATLVSSTGGDVTVTYIGDFAGDISNLYLYSVGGVPLGGLGDLVFTNDGSFAPGNTAILLDSAYAFEPGDELVFSLFNVSHNEGNDPANLENYGTYFTGPASRNPDSQIHAFVDSAPASGSYLPNQPFGPVLAGAELAGYQFAIGCIFGAGGAPCAALGYDGVTNYIPAGHALVGFEDRPDCVPVEVVCVDEAALQGDFDYNDLLYAFSNVRVVDPPQAPEPASLLLLGMGAAGYIARRRKQQKSRD